MKRVLIFFLIIFCVEINYAQNAKIDSLNNHIKRANTDTGRIKLLVTKAIVLSSINLDSAINLDMKTLEETGKIHYYRAEVDLRVQLVYDYSYKGNYKAALEQINYLNQYVNSSIDSTDFGKVYVTRYRFSLNCTVKQIIMNQLYFLKQKNNILSFFHIVVFSTIIQSAFQ